MFITRRIVSIETNQSPTPPKQLSCWGTCAFACVRCRLNKGWEKACGGCCLPSTRLSKAARNTAKFNFNVQRQSETKCVREGGRDMYTQCFGFCMVYINMFSILECFFSNLRWRKEDKGGKSSVRKQEEGKLSGEEEDGDRYEEEERRVRLKGLREIQRAWGGRTGRRGRKKEYRVQRQMAMAQWQYEPWFHLFPLIKTEQNQTFIHFFH